MLNLHLRPQKTLKRRRLGMRHQHRPSCPCNYCVDMVFSKYHYRITGQELPAEPANAC
jgi:hypothetical protein